MAPLSYNGSLTRFEFLPKTGVQDNPEQANLETTPRNEWRIQQEHKCIKDTFAKKKLCL